MGRQQQGWHGKRPDPHGKVCYSRVEAVGIWLLGGVLGGLIIRKPGAALAVELLAALVSAAVGNQRGITTLYSGLAQGLGAELVFLALAYRRWGLVPAALAGAGAAVGEWILEFALGNIAKSAAFNLIYLVTMIVSGAVRSRLGADQSARRVGRTVPVRSRPRGSRGRLVSRPRSSLVVRRWRTNPSQHAPRPPTSARSGTWSSTSPPTR